MFRWSQYLEQYPVCNVLLSKEKPSKLEKIQYWLTAGTELSFNLPKPSLAKIKQKQIANFKRYVWHIPHARHWRQVVVLI